jgi:hypothetical protein
MPADSHLRRLVLALALMGAMLVVAAPASPINIQETGPRINLYGPPTAFPADSPFHVSQGLGCDFSEAGCPQTVMSGSLFSLYVDGVLQPSKVSVLADNGGITKVWLTNFPDGLPTGDHTLVGVWSVNGSVLQTLTATITFT